MAKTSVGKKLVTTRSSRRAVSEALISKNASTVLSEWLVSRYLDPAKYRKQYMQAKPYPHIILTRLLKPKKIDELRETIVRLANSGGFTHKESDLFSLAQTPDLNASSDPVILSLRNLFTSADWRHYLTELTGVSLVGGALDIGGSLYQDTDFLLCHDDQVAGRKLAYILYVGPDFTAKDGGALTILNAKNGKPHTVVHRYPPRYNTLVLFTVSEKSWHAVEEVLTDKPRLSVNGWFH